MTVYLDTSALVGLHLDGPARAVVLSALDTDPDWCSSGLTLMESLALEVHGHPRISRSNRSSRTFAHVVTVPSATRPSARRGAINAPDATSDER